MLKYSNTDGQILMVKFIYSFIDLKPRLYLFIY